MVVDVARKYKSDLYFGSTEAEGATVAFKDLTTGSDYSFGLFEKSELKDAKYNIHFVATINELPAGSVVGFDYSVYVLDEAAGKVAKAENVRVFAELAQEATFSNGTSYKAADLAMKNLYFLEIKDIEAKYSLTDSSIEIVVTPFVATKAGDVVTITDSSTVQYGVIAVPAATRHFAYLSCGTWSLLGIESDEPIINEESFRQNFTNEGGIDGKIRFLKNICGLWIFEQCRTEWKDAPEDVGELVALCATTSFDSLIDPDAADFTHPASMCKAIDDYCQRTGQAVPTTPAEYCRCIFRSLALRYREVLDIFRTFAPVDALNIIGGGSRNKYLMQYTANAVGMTVTCGPTECTALGNALVQIRAEGRVQGIEQMRAISAASTQTITYEPCESEEWNAAYQRFIEIKNKNN